MKISVAPANMAKGCNECLQKSIALFTIHTVIAEISLCEKCMKEATDAIISTAIKARKLKITRR